MTMSERLAGMIYDEKGNEIYYILNNVSPYYVHDVVSKNIELEVRITEDYRQIDGYEYILCGISTELSLLIMQQKALFNSAAFKCDRVFTLHLGPNNGSIRYSVSEIDEVYYSVLNQDLRNTTSADQEVPLRQIIVQGHYTDIRDLI